MRSVIEWLGRLSPTWVYVAVGALATAEAVFVGLVLPGEIALLFGGYLASIGRVHLGWLLLIACLASVAGYLLGYEVGRHSRHTLRNGRLGRRIGAQRWDGVEARLAKGGGRAIFWGRFVGVLRAVMPAAAGAAQMPYGSFVVATVASGLIWAPAFVVLGYVAGHSYQRVGRIAGEASGLLFAAIVAVLAILSAARWVTRNHDRIQAAVDRHAQRPWIVKARMRYAQQLAFAARRLNPTSAVGLSLTIGLITVAGFGWAFGGVLEDVIKNEELASRDSPVAAWLVHHRVTWLTTTMRGITELGGIRIIAPVIVIVAAALIAVRRRNYAVFVAVVGIGTALLVAVIKLLIGRARPTADVLFAYQGFSFPSGHTAQAAATYGALAYTASSLLHRWGPRVAVWAVALAVVVLVGLSRLYLGVHWLTDVLGGATLGAAWLAVVVTTFRAYAWLPARRNALGQTTAHEGGGNA